MPGVFIELFANIADFDHSVVGLVDLAGNLQRDFELAREVFRSGGETRVFFYFEVLPVCVFRREPDFVRTWDNCRAARVGWPTGSCRETWWSPGGAGPRRIGWSLAPAQCGPRPARAASIFVVIVARGGIDSLRLKNAENFRISLPVLSRNSSVTSPCGFVAKE